MDDRSDYLRSFFASLIAENHHPRIKAAFAAVKREPFAGPGPWSILVPGQAYVKTPNDDVAFLYQDTLLAIRRIGTGADLQVAVKNGKLLIEASGDLPVLDFEKGAAIPVVPTSRNEFFVDGGDHTRIAFVSEGGSKATGMVLNPGPRQITGHRIN